MPIAKASKSLATSTKTKTQLQAVKAVAKSSWEAIYATIERIPRGSVSTYGTIAELAGLPRRARLVGTALKLAPTTRKLPWHRVVTASGRIAFPKGSDLYLKQLTRLKREGVVVIHDRVPLQQYRWPRNSNNLDELLWRVGPLMFKSK